MCELSRQNSAAPWQVGIISEMLNYLVLINLSLQHLLAPPAWQINKLQQVALGSVLLHMEGHPGLWSMPAATGCKRVQDFDTSDSLWLSVIDVHGAAD